MTGSTNGSTFSHNDRSGGSRPSYLALGCLVAAAVIAGCAETVEPQGGGNANVVGTAETPISVKLRLNWLPEAEHGGYYAALVHGYFKDEGLDVEILKGGPGVPVREEVATKRVDFGISNADQILTLRAEGGKILGVFAPLQTSPRCLLVHEKSGIDSFDGLKNMTIALSENSAFAAYLKQHVMLEGCSFVPYSGAMQRFLREDAFAMQGYVFSEPFTARRNGGDPRNLMAADIGFNPYTSVLIVHNDTVSARADLVRRMVRASRKGWEQYLADPDETNRYIHTQNPEMDLEILAFGAEQLVPLCDANADGGIGAMTLKRWTEIADLLVDCKVIESGAVTPDSGFTSEFLNVPGPTPAAGAAAAGPTTSE